MPSSQAPSSAARTRAPAGEAPELGHSGWFLSPPLFTSSGAPYRIVDVHCPGTDALEITFRRGWPNVSKEDIELDEKVFFDTCPGDFGAALAPGRAALVEVTATHNVR